MVGSVASGKKLIYSDMIGSGCGWKSAAEEHRISVSGVAGLGVLGSTTPTPSLPSYSLHIRQRLIPNFYLPR